MLDYRQMNRAGYFAFVLAVCAFVVPLVAQNDNEADKNPKSEGAAAQPSRNTGKSQRPSISVSEEWREMVFLVGDGITRDQQMIGESLMKILDNEELSAAERIRAAELLGSLRYQPAIPLLIKHIRLTPPIRTEAILEIPSALGNYGNAVIPHLVEAYVNQKSDDSSASRDRDNAFKYAITSTNAIRTAKIYAKGLAIETNDLEKQQRIKKLLEYLAEYTP